MANTISIWNSKIWNCSTIHFMGFLDSILPTYLQPAPKLLWRLKKQFSKCTTLRQRERGNSRQKLPSHRATHVSEALRVEVKCPLSSSSSSHPFSWAPNCLNPCITRHNFTICWPNKCLRLTNAAPWLGWNSGVGVDELDLDFKLIPQRFQLFDEIDFKCFGTAVELRAAWIVITTVVEDLRHVLNKFTERCVSMGYEVTLYGRQIWSKTNKWLI